MWQEQEAQREAAKRRKAAKAKGAEKTKGTDATRPVGGTWRIIPGIGSVINNQGDRVRPLSRATFPL